MGRGGNLGIYFDAPVIVVIQKMLDVEWLSVQLVEQSIGKVLFEPAP